jgi:hypothetical protein
LTGWLFSCVEKSPGRHRGRSQPWPDYESLTLFELSVASCVLTLTQPRSAVTKGPTAWKAA